MTSAIAVIRTQGERTESLCLDLALDQFDAVAAVSQSPFSEAVRECMRIGIRSGREWLVTIDADVLISPTYWEDMQPIIADADSAAWQILGRMDDKLSGSIRQGGVRAWRGSALPRLIDHVRDTVRPEGDLCARFPGWIEADAVTGRHDYEQFYRDLYRKGAAHRRKHPKWSEMVEDRWRNSSDRDLQAAYAGWHGAPLKFTEKARL